MPFRYLKLPFNNKLCIIGFTDTGLPPITPRYDRTRYYCPKGL